MRISDWSSDVCSSDLIDGANAALGDYAGKVRLVVNVASKCGLTPQYDALEKIYAESRDRGFVVLGFRANDFGGQEPGRKGQTPTFCRQVGTGTWRKKWGQ